MDQTTIVILGLLGVIVGIVAMTTVSVALASRGNAEAATLNRQENKPVSNGFAVVALVTLSVLVGLALVLGVLPPMLRRY